MSRFVKIVTKENWKLWNFISSLYGCSVGTQLPDSDITRQRSMGSRKNFNEDTDTYTVQLQAYILIHANHVMSQDRLLD